MQIKLFVPFVAGLCFLGYAWLLHIQAGCLFSHEKIWIALGIIFILKGIFMIALYCNKVHYYLRWWCKCAIYTTIVLFLGIFLSVAVYLGGSAWREASSNLDYLIVPWANPDWQYPQSTSCRSYEKARDYLTEYPNTILVIPGTVEDGQSAQADEQVMRYLSDGGISYDRILVVPEALTLKQSLKVSLEQIEQKQALLHVGSDPSLGRLQIGLLTDGIYTKDYKDYANKFGVTLISIPASIDLWYLPQLTVDEIWDYVIYHIEEAF